MEMSYTRRLLRILPFFLLIALILLADLFGFAKIFHLDTLRQHQKEISEFVANNALTAPLTFIGVFIASTIFCMPVAGALNLLGGFLFPQPLSTLYVILGETIGATLLYFLARTAVGRFMKKRAERHVSKIEKEMKEHTIPYLLFLRLVPFFPFWLVNIVLSFFKIPLKTYVWTTFFGLLPVTIVFTQMGRGLSVILQQEGPLTPSHILNPEIKLALLLLAICALLPLLLKKKMRRTDD